jgi:hypothetical protein
VMPSLKGLKPGDYRRLFPGDKSLGISPQGKVSEISPRIYIPGDKSPDISPPGMSGTVECGTAKPIDISQQNCTNLIQ